MAGRLYLLSLSSSFRDFLTEYTTNAALNSCQFRDGKKVVIHRFKVTGENTFLLVVQESGQNTVDSLVHQRLPGQLTVNSCTPLLDYETFANSLDVEIPEGTPLKLENGKFHWLEVTIDFPGKTVEDLLNVWKDEAALTVKAQRTTPMAVYKVVAERKVHVFNGSAPEHVDKVSFKLPITTALGSSVSIRTKAVERF